MLIHEHTDQERIEFQLRSDSRKTPNLHNLGRLLELSTRLKEVGTSFTRNGEMRTYGYPPLDEDIQQMLHLGVEYDDLWHAFFTGRTPEVEHNLWPVLRVLKKMLQNERVAFDDRHTRLNYGYGVSRIIRLSDQYDLLREEWFQKTLGDIHPALRWHNLSVRVEIRKTPAVVGWSFIRDQNSIARKKSRQAKYLTIIAEKQPSIHNGPSLTEQEADIAYRSPLDTREAAVSSSTSMPTPAYTAAVGRPHELTTAAPVLIHDSSPLHCANTASMLLAGNYFETHTASDAHKILQRPGSRQHEHGGVLGLLVEDERRRAEERPWHAEGQQRANVQAVEEEKVTSGKIGKKSHGFKKWLRSIFENSELAQSMDRAGRNVLGDL
ncbi:hypothetical protein N0V86_005603 [Didymella sp. IMI 355093]|nr:hypothetical protein N0V86_005603 [Didymella sp. IMI 355093]